MRLELGVMAPALTEASNPHHTLKRGATRSPSHCSATHSPDTDDAPLSLQYGGLKEPHAYTDAHLVHALKNGHHIPPSVAAAGVSCVGGCLGHALGTKCASVGEEILGLGPNGCGRREEGQDLPNPITAQVPTAPVGSCSSTAGSLEGELEEEAEAAVASEPPTPGTQSPTPHPCTMDSSSFGSVNPTCGDSACAPNRSSNDSAPAASSATTMGCHKSSAEGLNALDDTETKKSKLVNSHDMEQVLSAHANQINSSDIMALIGKDFSNMSEIIDTLQRLANNPEVMATMEGEGQDLPYLEINSNTALSQAHAASSGNADVSSTPQVAKEDQANTLVTELSRTQWELERRRARLLRRLRKVTARGLGATVSGQIRELLHYASETLADQKARAATVANSSDDPLGDLPLDILKADTMRSMSTSALVSLVRRMEISQGLARLAAARRPQPPAVVVKLNPEVNTELEALGAEYYASARHHHANHDSDATESSSGGESCDEADNFNDCNTHFVPIRERASYEYLKTRAWVASRWTWLQAQIADLEYRGLQQQKIYAHLRGMKGAVQLEESKSNGRGRSVSIRDPAHLDTRDPALTCLTTPSSRTALNGFHGKMEEATQAAGDPTCTAARTQAIRAIKRRRLVRAGAIVGLRKGGRLPSVKCKCVPPLTCVLCSRHPHQSQAIVPPDPDTQPPAERYARVDPSYHPVLSPATDVSLSEHFDAELKTSDWHRQVLMSKSARPPSISRNRVQHLLHTEKKKRRKDKDHKKEYTKKHKKEGKGRITLKLKKSLLTGDICKDGDYRKKRLASQDGLLTMKRVKMEEDDDTGSLFGSKNSSPSASPAPVDRSTQKKHSNSNKNKQGSMSSSYDIDNIVIPYSMAASTRVEKLEYKEIPTPKWRIVPLLPPVDPTTPSQEEDDYEDTCEEAYVARHNRSEELERKKFLQYLQMQVSSRSRARRTDSSGTNTPDHPMSPRPSDAVSDALSPLATPPATPQGPSEDSNHSTSLPASTSHLHSSGPAVSSAQQFGLSTNAMIPGLRRSRTVSIGKARSGLSWEEGPLEREEGGPPPYELRIFPLNDVEYASLVRECDCDIVGPPSPPQDLPPSTAQSGRSSPLSEVTDSAPEDDGGLYDDTSPEWTISGVKDSSTGQYVLQIQRNQ
ncbi:non-specific lethal 1 isoform X2 [Oratosquilla oratoria]|uniref:non-specific lethal 1 isoform X2 n=1 Tax=Oratosquilla oratoria TaxID=337810 RepID=UPI003F7600DB